MLTHHMHVYINIYTYSVTEDSEECPSSIVGTTLVRAVKRIIKVVKRRGRRGRKAVLAMPIITLKSSRVNAIAEEAVKENITVVTSAGKDFKFINS